MSDPRPYLLTCLVPCFNEELNLAPVLTKLQDVLRRDQGCDWRILFVDNHSTDGSDAVLRQIAREDARVLVIRNQRNFGHVRSPFHGLLQAPGDAVIVLPADLQVSPDLVPEFIQKWREGSPVVLAQRTNSQEHWHFRWVRRLYYRVVRKFADVQLLENTPGWGLYDRSVIEVFRSLDDPYPYVRGLISELGFPAATVPYVEVNRVRGLSKNNFYTLFDVAMLAMTSHSKVPLRLATMLGFALATVFGLSGSAYFVYKLVFWDRFPVGIGPVVIGLFFFASVQLFFIGMIGEYIGAIYTKVMKRPLVVEKERINFPPDSGGARKG